LATSLHKQRKWPARRRRVEALRLKLQRKIKMDSGFRRNDEQRKAEQRGRAE